MIFYILEAIWGGSLVFMITLVVYELRNSRDQDEASENDSPAPPPDSVSVQIASGDC